MTSSSATPVADVPTESAEPTGDAPSSQVDPTGPPGPPNSPTWTDPTARRASGAIGGPIGRYARTARMWTALSALMVITAGTLVLAFAQKSPCASGRWDHNLQYTHACYSDVLPLWSFEGFDKSKVPYRDHDVEYPVITGGFMYVSAVITRHLGPSLGFKPASYDSLFGVVTAVLLAFCGLMVTYFSVRTSRGRPWDAAIFAFSPLLIFHGFTNWDLLAMALLAAAMFAWSRERPGISGVLVGLGTAAKLYPILFLLVVVILAVRSGRRRPVLRCAAAAALAWVVVNAPIALAWFNGWKTFYVFSEQREAEASTVWAMGHFLYTTSSAGPGTPGGFHPNGALVALALLAAMGAVAALGLAAPTRPRVAQLTFLVVAGFLLTTKVWSPQYSLWLVPLVALARPRWRLVLLWQASEILVWIISMLWFNGFTAPDRNIDYGWLMFVLLVRDGFVIAIIALIIRDMWHPDADIVRSAPHSAYLDDPGGGVFDGAADVVSFALVRAARRRSAPATEGDDSDELVTEPLSRY